MQPQSRALIILILTLLGVAGPLRATDVLSEWDISVTTGAAPGYVPDDACAQCHEDKAESFAEMGMAKSFYRPSNAPVIEDFSPEAYYHAPSDRHYRIKRRGKEYWFSRYRLTTNGARFDAFEQRIDWILGSGHHSRIYLYQTADGALFQLPLSWYSQSGSWAMAPGYEFADHQGLGRAVRHRCMACHNAYPEVPVGSDRIGMPQTYPTDLPEGIGCQRCHGPGAEHIRLVLAGEGELQDVRSAIVNPGTLPRDQLYSICYGCHMQPSVAITPELHPGRAVYSFRPGQRLEDYAVQLDITDALRPREDRFDINHHPYRMEQSACFTESEGALGCLTCHDPHVKIQPDERAAHYRAKCLTCHETGADGLPVMASGAAHPAILASDDCTTCHMPARRTQDVIEVWMTDHRITRDPGPGDLLAAIPKEPAEVTGVTMLNRDHTLTPHQVTMFQSIAILRHTNGRADYATDALRATLERMNSPDYEPWMELAKALLRQQKPVEALTAAQTALKLEPGNPGVRLTVASSLLRGGNPALGRAFLEALLQDQPDIAAAQYNLAIALRAQGDLDAAVTRARRALALRHNFWPAWRLIGEIAAERGQPDAAVAAFHETLAINPDAGRVRAALVMALDATGQHAQTQRHRAVLEMQD